MLRFLEVTEPHETQPLAVLAQTDLRTPGSTKVYRWVPNLRRWVRDDDILRDVLSFPMDQLNRYREISAERAAELVRTLPKITARWVVNGYKAQDESIESIELDLPIVAQPRPVTDPLTGARLDSAKPGEWVPVRTFELDQRAAARTWASEVRRGVKKALAGRGPLEARVVPRSGQLVVDVRRDTGEELIRTARAIAERAHGLQVDKAGMRYIDHPRRVAERLAADGAPVAAIAAAWLHDVLEDTAITVDELRNEGIPEEVLSAVEAVSKRPGQDARSYAAAVLASPLGLIVKRGDLADNTDPERLERLDDTTRRRLEKKYAEMRKLLGIDAPSALAAYPRAR
ncbi:MAG: HD domain-containing protein [Protaetiibacter sp.]